MSFFLFVVAVVWLIFLQNRVGVLEQRIKELAAGTPPSKDAKKFSASAAAADVPVPSPEEFQKEGVHAGEMFRAATVAASPAPVPPSEYHAAATAEEKESHEEQTARWLGRIGAVAILAGVAFFLKYAFDNKWIDELGRVALGIIGGLTMIGIGHYLRAKHEKYLRYSDILIGGGIGILYLSLYGAFAFYHLIAQSTAFLLMALVTALGLVLSVTGNSRGLALLSIVGGFLTPVLLSTGTNQLVALSVYMLILDLGVMGIALAKKWGALNWVSFIGTVLLFWGWINQFYTLQQFKETFLFVSLFFLVFLVTSVLHHLVRRESTTWSDLVLLVANASGYFGVSVWLLEAQYADYEGFFTLLLALLYLALAYVSYTVYRADRTLNLFLPGIAIVFLTLAIPLQFSGYYVTLLWFAESVALVAIGLYVREKIIQIFGWIVLLLGMLSMGDDVTRARRCGNSTGFRIFADKTCDITPFLNMGFFIMSAGILTFSTMAVLYKRFRDALAESRQVMFFALVAAIMTAIGAFVSELSLEHRYFIPLAWEVGALLLLVTGLVARMRPIEILSWFALAIGGMMLLRVLPDIRDGIPMGGGPSSGLLVEAFINLGFFLLVFSVLAVAAFGVVYSRFKENFSSHETYRKVLATVLVFANLLTIGALTSEIAFKYDQDIRWADMEREKEIREFNRYTGGTPQDFWNPGYPNMILAVPGAADNRQVKEIDERWTQRVAEARNSKNTAITIFWTLYATLLIAIGFTRRIKALRIFGLVFFFVIAAKVFLDVWALGQFYRIVSSVVFGTIALLASFLYAKYKERIKSAVMKD